MLKIKPIRLDLLPFLAVIVASGPFLFVGFPDGHDSSYGLVRVAEFKTSLFNGQFPPFWAENLYEGYGSPIFLFYAPLYLVISTFCSVIGGSIATGMILATMIFSLLAVFGLKLVMNEALEKQTLEDQSACRVAVYFFLLNPYLIADTFVRNAYSEHAALCLAPFALYGLLIIGRTPLIGGVVLAASLGLIVIAHNLTALVIVSLVSTAALVLYLPAKRLSLWTIIVGNVALSLGLSAFFWVPAIYYTPLVRNEENVTGRFDFHNQFQPLRLFFGHDEFFSSGWLIPIVILIAGGMLFLGRGQSKGYSRRLMYFAFASALLFLFLQTRASILIWETVPYLPFFQFPWRMMGPLALVTSVLAGFIFTSLCRGESRPVLAFREVLLLGLCIANAVPHLQGARPLPHEISSKLSLLLESENIRNFGLSATYSNEYLPRFADPTEARIDRSNREPLVRIIPAGQVKVLENEGTKIIVETDAARPGTLRLARWFFPGWTSTVNGKPGQLEMNESGAIDIPVPAGLNRIVLELHPPLLRRLAIWASVASLTIWVFFTIMALQKKALKSNPSLNREIEFT